MPILLIERDPFLEVEDAADGTRLPGNVRRPLYGTTRKEPSFAYLRVYQDQGAGHGAKPISLINSSAPGGEGYSNSNFILQTVSEERQEKAQVVDTFGDHYVFFYGEQPQVLQVQGVLLNTADFNWRNEFIANYERYLRGTKCVENRCRVYLGYEDKLAQGYIMNFAAPQTAENPDFVSVQFSMLLTKPPLDLTGASDVLQNTTQGEDPWTYRSLEISSVADAQAAVRALLGESSVALEAAAFGGSRRTLLWYPEYIGRVIRTERTRFNPITGDAETAAEAEASEAARLEAARLVADSQEALRAAVTLDSQPPNAAVAAKAKPEEAAEPDQVVIPPPPPLAERTALEVAASRGFLDYVVAVHTEVSAVAPVIPIQVAVATNAGLGAAATTLFALGTAVRSYVVKE